MYTNSLDEGTLNVSLYLFINLVLIGNWYAHRKIFALQYHQSIAALLSRHRPLDSLHTVMYQDH